MIVRSFQTARKVPERPKKCDAPCPTVLVAIPQAKKGSDVFADHYRSAILLQGYLTSVSVIRR